MRYFATELPYDNHRGERPLTWFAFPDHASSDSWAGMTEYPANEVPKYIVDQVSAALPLDGASSPGPRVFGPAPAEIEAADGGPEVDNGNNGNNGNN